jgi:hypothetical protein
MTLSELIKLLQELRDSGTCAEIQNVYINDDFGGPYPVTEVVFQNIDGIEGFIQ